MKFEILNSKRELVSQKRWEEQIDKIKKEVGKESFESEEAVKRVEETFLKVMEEGLPKEKFGIMFSGGIDSTIIAHIAQKMDADFKCYTVGMPESDDIKWAKKIAEEKKFEITLKELTLEDYEKEIEEVTKLLKEADVIKIGVAAAIYPGMKEAKKDGIKYLYSGLGSEEIFAGYQRHEESEDIQEECWAGLRGRIWEKDLTRDIILAKSLGMEWKTPFLEPEMILTAMKVKSEDKIIPSDQKNKKKMFFRVSLGKAKQKEEGTTIKKVVIRKVAEKQGLSKEYSWRKKKAAQYGSKSDRAILRIARKKGYKYKKEYIKSILRIK